METPGSGILFYVGDICTLISSFLWNTYLHGNNSFSLSNKAYYNYYMSLQEAQTADINIGQGNAPKVQFWKIFLKIKVYALSVCLVFTATLAVFPPVTASVKSIFEKDGSDWGKKYFIPVGCFLIFSVGDYVGRSLAGHFHLPKTRIPLLPVLCILRLVFIPLMMLCNAHPRYYSEVVFYHDAYFIVFMILFSLSSGYLASQAMIHGPKEAADDELETAGAMMAFFLGLGLMLGSASSNIFVRIL